MAKKRGHCDPTIREVLERAFLSLPLHQQVLAVAEAAVEAASAAKDSTLYRGQEMLQAVLADVSKAYRSGKLRAMTKHRKETEVAIAITLRLLMKKHALGIGDAADVLGLGSREAERILKRNSVRLRFTEPKTRRLPKPATAAAS